MTRQEHIELVARAIAKVKHNDEYMWPFYTVSAAAITALERAGAYVGEK